MGPDKAVQGVELHVISRKSESRWVVFRNGGGKTQLEWLLRGCHLWRQRRLDLFGNSGYGSTTKSSIGLEMMMERWRRLGARIFAGRGHLDIFCGIRLDGCGAACRATGRGPQAEQQGRVLNRNSFFHRAFAVVVVVVIVVSLVGRANRTSGHDYVAIADLRVVQV